MDSQEVKELLGQRAKEVIASGLGLRVNKSGKVLCPLHSEKTPSMSWYKEGLMWRCHSCKGKIDIYDYYTKFENISFVEAKEKIIDMVGGGVLERSNRAMRKTYAMPKIQMRELSQEAIDLMAVRKITKETLEAWKVKESTWNGVNVYVYQYFHNEILKYVSYREIKSKGFKGGCEANTEPILWGMWHVESDRPLVITEGQPDAMVIWQSGYKNVVSAPNGANNLAWIENCWDWLQGREIIVWADNDKPGIEFAENIKRRLENVKIIIADDRKDANEVLYSYGSDKVMGYINEAINEMPLGMLDMSRQEYKPDHGNGIETGFYQYDSYVKDWREGQLTIIFGRNGEGKTTFVSQVIAHCLEKRVKTFLYSGEMSEFKIQDWLYKQLIGNKKDCMYQIKTKYAIEEEIKPHIIKKIKEWHEGLFYLFDTREEHINSNLDKFFDLMELAARRYGVKLFVVDNLMSKLEENADSLYSDQANFVQRCKDFARNNMVHVVLVAHPNKEKGEITGDEGNLSKNDISGSNNIANKSDNIIAVERNWSSNRQFDCIVTSLKDRQKGERRAFKYMFSPKTLRFYNDYTQEEQHYRWELGPDQLGFETEEKAPWDL